MKVLTQLHRKVSDYEELSYLSNDKNLQWLDIQSTIKLSESEFNYFIHNLHEDYEFLSNTGQHLFYVTDGEEGIVVDTQGYNYPKYTGLLKDRRN